MTVYHKNQTGADLHVPFLTNAGCPEGVVTAGTCKWCFDTENNILWYNSGTGNTGWEPKITGQPLWYGVEWDEATDTYTRIGSAAGYDQGFNVVPDSLMPAHGAITCGLLTEDGETFTEFDPDNWDLDIHGNAVSRDGSMGNSMQRFRKTYFKYENSGTKHRYMVSLFPLAGFTVHPAFVRSGQEIDYFYHFTYEASLYDDSAGAYIGGADSASYAAGDKLVSRAGIFPKTNMTIVECRAAAAAIGTGHHQQYEWQMIFKRLMVSIEAADFNIQNYYDGLTTVSSGDWDTYNSYAPLVQCGCTDSLASGTGEVEVTLTDFPTSGIDEVVKPFRWRGCENYFGHLWEWSDGFNIQNVEADGKSYAWLCQNPDDFTSDTESNYTKVGELPTTDGWITSVMDDILLPDAIGGSSATKFGDYYYTIYNDLEAGFVEDWRVARVSAGSGYGLPAGSFYVYSSNDSSNRTRAIVSRGGF